MFKRLIKRIKSRMAWNETRRLQEARAVSMAVQLTITGALRRHA
jgi:hypothetical protein